MGMWKYENEKLRRTCTSGSTLPLFTPYFDIIVSIPLATTGGRDNLGRCAETSELSHHTTHEESHTSVASFCVFDAGLRRPQCSTGRGPLILMRVIEKIVGRLPCACAFCWVGLTCFFFVLWWPIFFVGGEGVAPAGWLKLGVALFRFSCFLAFAAYFFRRARSYSRLGEVRAATVRSRFHIVLTSLAAVAWGYYGAGNFVLYEPIWEFLVRGVWSEGWTLRYGFLKVMSIPTHFAAFLTGIYYILFAILRIYKWRQRIQKGEQ